MYCIFANCQEVCEAVIHVQPGTVIQGFSLRILLSTTSDELVQTDFDDLNVDKAPVGSSILHSHDYQAGGTLY